MCVFLCPYLRVRARPAHSIPFTLRTTLYTLHPALCTLHPTPYTLHPTPYALRPTLYALRPTPYTLHPTPCKHPVEEQQIAAFLRGVTLKDEPVTSPFFFFLSFFPALTIPSCPRPPPSFHRCMLAL